MAPAKNTPVQLSGGAGFDFEDAIAARFLLSMLRGEAVFGAEHGTSVQLDFQVGESGWLLDDLLLASVNQQEEISRAAISVKIPKQITTASGFHASFRDAVWAQWAETASGPFDKQRDLLCLAMANVADTVWKAWHELQNEVLDTSTERFLERVESATRTKRAIFSSLIPDQKNYPNVDESEVVELFRRVRLLKFDFHNATSVDSANAVVQCRALLTDELDRSAEDLWDALRSIAKEHRASGGTITLQKLVGPLVSAGFRLAQHPVFSNDWIKLGQLSDDARGLIRRHIGEDIELPRAAARTKLRQIMTLSSSVALLGPSGVGKSALLVQEVGKSDGTIVWLNAGHFGYANAAEQRTALALEHDLGRLLASSTSANNTLVIDAAEAFSKSELQLLASALNTARKEAAVEWSLVFTCQTHAWDSVRGLLYTACDLQPEPHELGSIDEKDVDHVLKLCGISQFRNEKTAKQLFGNLKILDWVVCALATRPLQETTEKTSIKAILDIVWRFWVGQGTQRHAAAKLLSHLGVEQAATFAKGISFNALEYPALDPLAELESRDVLRTNDETVYFSHDLTGDWVRFRALCQFDDTMAELRTQADNPLWHPAIRLYGQSLLDQHDDAQLSWDSVQQDIRDGSAQGDIVGDLLLDSVYSHPDAYAVLTRYRELFLVENSALFRRIAKRFLIGATVADPRAAALATEDDMRSLLEASMRVPLWLRWPPMLKFLFDNVADVSSLTSPSVAKICALWLQHTPSPSADDAPYPFRQEAASVALALAREVQALNEEGVWFQGKDKTYYEAALLAAPDLPDAVGQFALEMSYRRPLDAGLQKRLADFEEKRRLERLERAKNAPKKKRPPVPIMSSVFRGDRLDPWPSGPTEGVREEFREAAWSGNGLTGLIEARPAVAAELILALCIEEPGYEYDRDSPLGKPGLAYSRATMPDSYFNGPFLTFLRSNTSAAIDLIAELVNFVTDRWVDQGLRRYPEGEAPHIELPLNDEEVSWYGDWQVYGWYRGSSGSGCPVSCALMAVEKWFYEQLAADGDVSVVIEKILNGSRSAAFAGVLCAIGKKQPALFLGPLRPLFGDARIFEVDRILVQNHNVSGYGSFLWARHGEIVFEALRAWHAMEHRLFDLRDIAQRLLLIDDEMRTFLSSRIAIWEKEGDAHEYLCAQLDIENYTRTKTDDGGEMWEFDYPEALEAKATEGQQASQFALWLMNFPYQCQQLFDGDEGFATDQLVAIANRLQELPESDPNPDPFVQQKKVDTVLAGFSVFMHQHRAWLRENAEFEQWGRAYVDALLENPPTDGAFDSPVAINPAGWEAWAARLAVLLLSEDPANERWRKAVAELIMAPHYMTTGVIMQTAFAHHDELGDDFMRLQNLAKLWSAVELVRDRETNTTSSRRKDQLVRAFVSGTLPATPLSLVRIAEGGRRFQIRQRIREYRPFGGEDIAAAIQRIRETRVSGLNWMLALQSMSWMPDSMGEVSDELRSLVEHEFSDVSSYCLSLAPSDPEDKSNDKVPSELVTWWLQRISTLSMELAPEKGKQYWQPVMDLGIAAHYWVDSFVSSFFITGATTAGSPERFQRRWQPLMEYALSSIVWQKQGYRDYRRSRTMSDVMGLRTGASYIGELAYAGVITSLKDHYQQWSTLWLHDNESANAFAAFLSRPSAGMILADGIIWLSAAVAEYSKYDWREDGLTSNLALALQRAWKDNRSDVVKDGPFRDAFFALLSLLVQKQDEVAVVLQREVVEAISS